MLRSTGASWRERYGMSSAVTTAAMRGLTMTAQNASSKEPTKTGFIHELVLAATQPRISSAQGRPAARRLRGDEQGLEGRPAVLAHAKHAGEQSAMSSSPSLRALQRVRLVLAGEDAFRDAAHRAGGSLGVISLDPLVQQPHDLGTGTAWNSSMTAISASAAFTCALSAVPACQCEATFSTFRQLSARAERRTKNASIRSPAPSAMIHPSI